MPDTQNFKNHARFDPPMHFFVFPVVLANFIVQVVALVHSLMRTMPTGRHPHTGMHIWSVVVALAVVVIAAEVRVYSLKVQDRVIRMEEHLRYASLLSPAALVTSASLTVRQMVALRFASDAELPALLERAVAENLNGKQIKQSIQTWRPDYQRV